MCAAKTASLLFPDGSYYVGSLNGSNQRHGDGSMYSAEGNHLSIAGMLQSGLWIDDALVTRAVAPVATLSASSASSSSVSCVQRGRKALLIGNNKYDALQRPLMCCTHDAHAMQSALTQLGFKCTVLPDATERVMCDGIIKFTQSLEKNDIVFIYFSGHGEEFGGVTYLLPIDMGDSSESLWPGCPGLVPTPCRDRRVSLLSIMDNLNEKDCNLINIIVLDCCRSLSDESGSSGASSVPARSMAERAHSIFEGLPSTGQFYVSFSADPDNVATEGFDGYGWFTAALLPHLTEPGLQIEQIFKRANKSLREISDTQQIAWQHSTLVDDVILRPTSS